MAKKRKPPSTSTSATAMELDLPKKSILSANTQAGISKSTKPTRLPRGKGRRAQRLRKEKAGVRAEEVKGRTERKVERSMGKGKRKGERNVGFSVWEARWEDMNEKIKGVLEVEWRKGKGKGEVRVGGEKSKGGEEEWVDEDGEDGMVDVEEVGGGKQVGDVKGGMDAIHGGGDRGEEVEDGVL
ncbi:MAG: hypothetical protein Q9225_003721 [Loekoesia sp. 1 TL-2023]